MNISKNTIIRTALFFGMMIILDVFSVVMLTELVKHNLLSNEMATGYAATLIGANATAVRAWWKNNSFTESALLGDSAMYEQRGLKMIENGEIKGNVEREEEYAKEKGLM